MVESQPGKVIHFDPSVSLSNFSAEKRDHLIFNENQIVLAKVQRVDPVFAHATNRSTSNTLTVFDSYKNVNGGYVYVDGSFQALSTIGVPTSDVYRITVGFDRQITSDTITFWSTTFVDTTRLVVEYSFDNNTWFAAGAVTWVQVFDDTIQISPDDVPPTGEFKYTGTIDGGSLTARYWRIRSDAEATYISGTSTYNVDTTEGFPSAGTFYIFSGVTGGALGTRTYTGKTSTSFTGVSPATSVTVDDKIVALSSAFGNNVTEVRIIQVTDPILQHWNSDGTQAVTNAVEGEDYYHLAYDKNEDVYYAIRLNNDLNGTGPTLSDNFNADTGVSFDSFRWTEDTTKVHFVHSTSSGTLDYKSPGGEGELRTNYSMPGNYTVDVDLVALVGLPQGDVFSLEVDDPDTGNQQAASTIKGPYPEIPGSASGSLAVFEFGSTTLKWSQDKLITGFGTSASISDADIISIGSNTVYIYDHSGGLLLSESSTLAYGVDIKGSVAAAVVFDSGYKLRVYEKSGAVWSKTYETALSGAGLGPIAVESSYIFVGATEEDNNRGEVQVFEKDVGSWGPLETLTASDAAVNDFFGSVLAVDGETLAVGFRFGFGSEGSVYVFNLTAGSWVEGPNITGLTSGDSFGSAITLAGTKLLIGAKNRDTLGSASGAVFYYSTAGSLIQTITASDGSAFDQFGGALHLSGNTLAVLPTGTNDKCYTFEFNGSTWDEDYIIDPEDSALNKVSVAGDTVSLSSSSGVYLYLRNVSFSSWDLVATRQTAGSPEDALGKNVATVSGVVVGGIPLSDLSSDDGGGVKVI
jgi:hypothetical protein